MYNMYMHTCTKSFILCLQPPTVLLGAMEHIVCSADEALSWLESGNTARVTAATQMNQRSSRSHAVFTVHIGKLVGTSNRKQIAPNQDL